MGIQPRPILPINSHSSHQLPFFPAKFQSTNENSREIRGCFFQDVVVPSGKVGAEGLEPPTPSV